MLCGISTACLYPQDTLESLEQVAALQPDCMEVFLNTFREWDAPYLDALCRRREEFGIPVVSVHPFTSGLEPFLFFTSYETRFEDGLALYRRYFEACQALGARILVFHGNHKARPIPMQDYAARFCRLCEEAERFGIIVAQENVDRCQCGQPEALRQLRRYATRPLHFVLDLKQARRAGAEVLEVARAMGPENICHLHLSDATPESCCLAPGKGCFDLAGLLKELFRGGFRGSSVIELYRGDFGQPEELAAAVAHVRAVQKRMEAASNAASTQNDDTSTACNLKEGQP